jgi:serine/threonine protein kinase
MNDDPQRVKSLFLAALDMASEQQGRFLDEACAGDPELRRRVDRLLQAHERPDSLPEVIAALGPTQDSAHEQDPSPQSADFIVSAENAGRVIGPYKLLQPIGEGGMGTVYLAEQMQPVQRKVALKIIKAGMDSRQVIARFEAERQALALMDHPNIAKVHDAGTTDSGRPYFVMELVKGQPITRYCDKQRLTPRQRLELFLPVCEAIQHAHQKGIIHRDIKPSNVLVAPYDGRPVVKVIDFGVAKAVGQQLTDKTLFTEFGTVVGTLECMSPEQAEVNNQDIDTRSDVYSLGVLLYELLTGSTPLTRQRVKDAGLLEVLRVIREEEPPKPSTRLSTTEQLPSIAAARRVEPARLSKLVRGELDWIVMKSLEKDRNRRYESANGLALDIQRYLADEPVQACPPSTAYRLRKFARRNKASLTAGALIAAGLILTVVVLVVSSARVLAEEKAKDQAYADKLEALESRRQAAYYRQVNVAFNEWQAARVGRADQLLDECPKDLRGWEWRYLKRLCHEDSVMFWPDRFKRRWAWQLPKESSSAELPCVELP